MDPKNIYSLGFIFQFSAARGGGGGGVFLLVLLAVYL